MTTTGWSVSGLCVTARPEKLEAIETMLSAFPGIEVHARDPRTGRLVVIQERPTLDAHRQGLRSLQALPDVLTAELVFHYQDRDTRNAPDNQGESS